MISKNHKQEFFSFDRKVVLGLFENRTLVLLISLDGDEEHTSYR